MKPSPTELGSLASLDLTHILYDASSSLSFAFALVTLSPILLMASYAALVVVTRDLLILNMWIGQLACEGFSWLLKRLIKAERPYESHGNGYGFPSSHSQYMGYFASFLLLHLWCRHRFSPGNSPRSINLLQHLSISSLIVAWAVIVCYSRYYLYYHTPSQIIWGFSLGILFGALHYTITELLPMQYFGDPRASTSLPTRLLHLPFAVRSWILSCSIGTWVRLKDGWVIWDDGGYQAGWVTWRREWDTLRLERAKIE